MTYVKAKSGEPFEALWKRFKRSVEKAGVLSDLKKHDYYEKPSVKKKKKQAAARKRAAKTLKKLERAKARKGTNKNFKWNKDHTKKIPLPPRKPYVPGQKPTGYQGKKPYKGNKPPGGKPYRGNNPNRSNAGPNTRSGNTNRPSTTTTNKPRVQSKPPVDKGNKR